MILLNELDSIIRQLDADASEAQAKSGSVSWKRVREMTYRLVTLSIGTSLVPNGEYNYLKDYHHITNSGIGLAKIALLRGNPTKAMEYLQAISAQVDISTIRNLPKQAQLQQLVPLDRETEDA